MVVSVVVVVVVAVGAGRTDDDDGMFVGRGGARRGDFDAGRSNAQAGGAGRSSDDGFSC